MLDISAFHGVMIAVLLSDTWKLSCYSTWGFEKNSKLSLQILVPRLTKSATGKSNRENLSLASVHQQMTTSHAAKSFRFIH